MDGYRCGECGSAHEGTPTAFFIPYPDVYLTVPVAERERRVELTDETCFLDGRHFMLRGDLAIPVLGRDEPLVLTLWASLSRDNMKRTIDHWEDPKRIEEPRYTGWLCNALRAFPSAAHVPLFVETRPVGQRPALIVQPGDFGLGRA